MDMFHMHVRIKNNYRPYLPSFYISYAHMQTICWTGQWFIQFSQLARILFSQYDNIKTCFMQNFLWKLWLITVGSEIYICAKRKLRKIRYLLNRRIQHKAKPAQCWKPCQTNQKKLEICIKKVIAQLAFIRLRTVNNPSLIAFVTLASIFNQLRWTSWS